MDYFVLGFIGVALIHFGYEGIVAPSLRMNVRYRLFALRDEIRALKATQRDEFSDRHYTYLQDIVNREIRFVPRFDVVLMIRAISEIEKDPELRSRVEARARILDDCNLPKAKKLRDTAVHLMGNSIRINNGALAIYLIPIGLAVVCYSRIKKGIKALVALPSGDFERLAPAGQPAEPVT